jgi:hypothetical protein
MDVDEKEGRTKGEIETGMRGLAAAKSAGGKTTECR